MRVIDESNKFESDLIMTSNTFGELRHILIKHIGLQQAKRFLLQYGFNLGKEKSKEIKDRPQNREELILLAAKLHLAMGHALKIEGIGQTRREEDQLLFENIHGAWVESFEAKQHLKYFPLGSECACNILSGFASGILTELLEEDIYVKEVDCITCGADKCYFEIRSRKEWEALGETLEIFEAQTLESELHITYDKLAEKEALLRKVTTFHSHITDSIVQHNRIEHLLETAYHLIQIPVAIYDVDGDLLYTEAQSKAKLFQNEKDAQHISKLQQTKLIERKNEKILITPIYLKLTKFGYCAFHYSAKAVVPKDDYFYLERLASAASLCFLNEKVSFEATERLKINFLDRLLHQHFQHIEEINTQARYIQPKLQPPFTIVTLKCDELDSRGQPVDRYLLLLQLARDLKRYSIHALLAQYDDYLVILAYNVTSSAELATTLKKLFTRAEQHLLARNIKAGISSSFQQLNVFANYFAEAQHAMNAFHPDNLLFFQQLGPLSSLLSLVDTQAIYATAQKELGPLLTDEPRMKELLTTLYVFLKNNQHLELTVQRLSLSIGGIRYRINQIEKLLQKDLKDATSSAFLLLLLESLISFNLISIQR